MNTLRSWSIAAAFLACTSLPAFGQNYLISTYAGGLPGTTAAQGTAYSFRSPAGIATDLFGAVYISATDNAVFRLDPNGILSRIAGTGKAGFSGDGGSAVKAQLNTPQGVAVDAAGNLYIADQANNLIRRVTPQGIISTVAGNGTAGFLGDTGPATAAELNAPQSVAVDAAGNLYIADTTNLRIRMVTPGGTITTVAGTGQSGHSGDGGPATAATFAKPVGIAVSPAGKIYVVDAISCQVRQIVPGGNISLVAGNGTAGASGNSGPATLAQLNNPLAVSIDRAGNLYIADYGNTLIRKVDAGGIISIYAGGGSTLGDGGPATSAQLIQPISVAIDRNNNLYIADVVYRVRVVNAAGNISTIAEAGIPPSSGDSAAAGLAELSAPWGLARDGSGNLYIADWRANRVRRVGLSGNISTFAGTGANADSGDGGPATSAAVTPRGIAVDSSGNIYLGDLAFIRKIDTSGNISTIAGTGISGFSGDGGPATAAQLGFTLAGLAVDAQHNVYFSDSDNRRVRKITAAGVISTVAGTNGLGYSGDNGPATSAQLNFPTGLAFDSAGNLYICDYSNNRVRKVALDGTITTFAGNGGSGSTGDNGPATSAQVANPWGVAFDGTGNLYISSQANVVRKVAGGTITTIAGTGTPGYTGDGGLAAAAELNYPIGVSVDSSGNVYVSEFNNGAIRVLQPSTSPLLTVSSIHTNPFISGQQGVYTLNVADAAGAGSTSGTVTVTDTLPASLTPVAMAGTGWLCSFVSTPYNCTTSATKSGGGSFNSITLMVNVASGALPQVTNQVTVSGGGSSPVSADDVTDVGSNTPVLQIVLSHLGAFGFGGQGTYTITIRNQPFAVSSAGLVTVTDTLPTGLSLVSMSGTNWSCSSNTCTRSDALPGGQLYEPITVTVAVSSNAPFSVTNTASVSGGGSTGATSNDPTSLVSTGCNVTGDPSPSATDIQAMINEALGVNQASHDLNQDGKVNLVDVQIVLNAVQNLGCTL